MVDKDQELLKFVKIHWKMMLRPDFPEQYYKETKKDYFSHFLRNRLGIPRDREIAKIVLDYLLRIGYIKSKNHLEDVLQKPFISKNIYDHEIYLQKFEMTQQKDELDLGLIEKQDYEMSKSEEYIEESIEGSTPESDDKIEEKISSTESTTPALDQQQNITEPSVIIEIRDKESQFDPWWKRLGLISNPFPDTDGLGTIKQSLYERITVITKVFEKYIHYIDKVPSELFKNVIFYGEFGSGKTTLFEYLQAPLVKNNIQPAIIRLSAEPDYQNLMRFKQKLSRDPYRIITLFLR